jgi:hypothetical protein
VALAFTQTDSQVANCNTVAELGGDCTGHTGGVSTSDRQCLVGGTAGVNGVTDSVNTQSTGVAIFMGCVPAAGINWNAGTWTVRFNITSSNMFLTVIEIYICRQSSACTFVENLGSATGLSIGIGSTGVISQTVSTSAPSEVNTGDIVSICVVFQNTTMSDHSFTWLPNQNIDSPFTEEVPAGIKRVINVRQAVNRASTY